MAGMKENVRNPLIGFGRECFGNYPAPPPGETLTPVCSFHGTRRSARGIDSEIQQ